ncbi:MAG: hypothetical protein G01um101456_258 [Parcubacteria group bacterium Gr01-1014_56]|nr:MAG: hypothetical protein G01um101456_258 [Parcubacteria group bacterium Gr01-1014_56]
MRNLYFVFSLLLGLSLGSKSAAIGTLGIVEDLLGCISSPCIPKKEFYAGGSIAVFLKVVAKVQERRITVVVSAPCYSACALFADKARPFVCIKQGASFGFHKSALWRLPKELESVAQEPMPIKESTGANAPLWFQNHGYRFNGYRDPEYSSDVKNYLDRRGGAPIEKFLMMSYKQAKKFWPVCQ